MDDFDPAHPGRFKSTHLSERRRAIWLALPQFTGLLKDLANLIIAYDDGSGLVLVVCVFVCAWVSGSSSNVASVCMQFNAFAWL